MTLNACYCDVTLHSRPQQLRYMGFTRVFQEKYIYIVISPPILDRFLKELGQIEGKTIVFTITKDYSSIILAYIVTLDLRIHKTER